MDTAATAERATLRPSVAATLDVLAAELEVAGARCLSLDRLIGEIMQCLSEQDRSRMLQSLHGVDLLTQHLSCLSTFARGMSRAAPADVTVSADHAVSAITLSGLAERMAAGLGGAAPECPRSGGDGDVDLF